MARQVSLRCGWRTRFAPSPTGYLHRGHLAHAVCVWGVARAHGGTIVVRMEDHDRVRCKPEYERALLSDLEWLGLIPDEGLSSLTRHGPSAFRQSDCNNRYASAMEALRARGLVYSCTCSRRDIAAVVGDAEGDEARYPGTCRTRSAAGPGAALRLVLPPDVMRFADVRHGVQQQCPAEQCGDLLIRDRRGQWTYQFAVAVDDLAHDIDVVIRGDDLLPSTGRQLLVRQMLVEGEPSAANRVLLFLHHPVVRHPDGTKLSKAASDTGIAELRRAGMRPEVLLADAAKQIGFTDVGDQLSAGRLGALFSTYCSWFTSDGAPAH